MISIITPCWNETERLKAFIDRVRDLPGVGEVVLADASEDVRCAIIAESAGVKVVRCDRPHRGRQLNAGAAAASGEVLLFQHVDTELTADHTRSLASAIQDPAVLGGAFYRRFHADHRLRQWLAPVVRRYNRSFGALYGDQSIFVRTTHFRAIGGYADIPLMEDVELSRRLRRTGRLTLLDPPMGSSARRHRKHGALTVTMENMALLALYRLGVSPHRLHRWYYRS